MRISDKLLREYVEWRSRFTGDDQSKLEQKRARVLALRKDLSKCQERCIDNRRRLSEAKSRLAASQSSSVRQGRLDELKELLDRREVRSVRARSTHLDVYLKPIVIEGRLIGPICIIVSCGFSQPAFSVHDFGKSSDDSPHPFVGFGGLPCPVIGYERVLLAVADRRPAVAAGLLIDMLIKDAHAVPSDDSASPSVLPPCRPLDGWPLASDEAVRELVERDWPGLPCGSEETVKLLAGLPVRIRSDSCYSSQNSGVGIIVGEAGKVQGNSSVDVSFTGGYSNQYRVGCGRAPCDLVAVSKEEAVDYAMKTWSDQYLLACGFVEDTKLKERISLHERECQSALDCVRYYINAVSEAVAAVSELERMPVRDLEAKKRELAGILSLPDVEGASVSGDCLKVGTGVISILESGRSYKIGRFSIEISCHAGADYMRFYNLSDADKKDGGVYDHPHVKKGVPCLGNMKHSFNEAFSKRQVKSIVVMAVEFLKSYCCDGDYRPFRGLGSWE